MTSDDVRTIVREELAAVRTDVAELSTGLAAVRTELADKPSRTEVAAEGEKTRRHFDVVAEDLRAQFKGVIDLTLATGEKVDRLIASNAAEHAAFVDVLSNHEGRLRVLEGLKPTG